MTKTVVSVIIPVYNGEKWIVACMDSIIRQELPPDTALQVCIYNDGSTDGTLERIWNYRLIIDEALPNISLGVRNGPHPPRGVGYGKNQAVELSRGDYLCFQDIDDVMMPTRIMEQLKCAQQNPEALIGSKFTRHPADSTMRFTKWANELPASLLNKQVLTSHGPTIVMPTWFCHRQVFEKVGGFSEDGRGTPEDLIFFFKHLDLGGPVLRIDQPLLVYTYHPNATTLSISEKTIWDLRVKRLEETVLPNWESFTIWNAGKQGRKLWKDLSKENKAKVSALCDVDVQKIGTDYRPYSPEDRFSNTCIPIRHFRECSPPFVICVKMDLTGGHFEDNLASLNLEEGRDYVMFS